MPMQKKHEVNVSLFMPATMVQRMERVAPVADGQRSEFIRKAVAAALDQAERKQADSAA
jgi:metal-responsive CopG/Arc/MetJ family transcriptional regulator